jgi:hypothetical protein
MMLFISGVFGPRILEKSSHQNRLLDVCHLDYVTMVDLDLKFFSDCKNAWGHDSGSEIFWLIAEISTQAYLSISRQTFDERS